MNVRSDSMKAYMQEIGEYPLISKEEEVELAARIKEGDDAALQKLIKANLRLVVKIAHDFKGFGLPLLDLIAEGNIGLMRAAEKFDPAKGAKFSSYSAWWIKQSMRRALSQKSRTIRIPVASAGKINRIRTAKIQLSEKLGRQPTDAEIAEACDLTHRTVQGLKLADFRTFSLHDPIQKGEDGSFEDIIPDTSVAIPNEVLEDTENVVRLRGLLTHLDDREQRILTLRYGLDGSRPKTLEEVSKIIGRTRERVRQIQMQSLRKLRSLIESEEGLVLPEEQTGHNGHEGPTPVRHNGSHHQSRRALAHLARGSNRGQRTATVGLPVRRLPPDALGHRYPSLIDCNDQVEDLALSSRSRNGLHSVGIRTVGQLARATGNDLLAIRYFGVKCLNEVKDALQAHGERLVMAGD